MQKYLLEIKNRVLLLLASYFSVVLISYYYKEILLFIILKPNNLFNKSNFFYFIFTDVTEIFYVYFRLIFFLSIQIIILMIFYHFFLFISPALYKNEFKKFKFILMSMIFVNLISFTISYFIIIPFSWDFFLSFQDLLLNKSFTIHFEAKLIEYFNFYISLYYICGLYFQCFVLFFIFLNFLNNNLKNMKKLRKIFYFGFVTFSALICPEIFSQILISFLFILMYEIFLFIYIFNSKYFMQATN